MNIDNLQLRPTLESDLETLFSNQLDPEANRMAAFIDKDPTDKEAYMSKWTKIVASDKVNMQTALINEQIVGSVLHFDMFDETNVSYWIGKEFWGKGIATKALALFVESTEKRPLYGRVAFDNYGSKRVLEKNGFVEIGTEKGFANGRGKEIEEAVYKLD